MRQLSIITILFIFLLGMSACNEVESNTYKTIKSAVVAYDAAMTTASDYAKNDIDDEVKREKFKQQVITIATPVYDSLVFAANMGMVYSSARTEYESALALAGNGTNENISELEDKMNAAKAALNAALNNINIESFVSMVNNMIKLSKHGG